MILRKAVRSHIAVRHARRLDSVFDVPEPAGIRPVGIGGIGRFGEIRRRRIEVLLDFEVFDAG